MHKVRKKPLNDRYLLRSIRTETQNDLWMISAYEAEQITLEVLLTTLKRKGALHVKRIDKHLNEAY